MISENLSEKFKQMDLLDKKNVYPRIKILVVQEGS